MLRQSGPGVPSGAMVCLRVLARTGRADCRRSCASFLPSSGFIAMSIFCVVRWQTRAARSSGCASKSVGTRKSSSYLARRLATAGLQLATVMMMCIRIIQRCNTGAVCPHPGFVESLFFISSRSGTRTQVFEMLPSFSCISWACVFAGDGYAIFSVGSLGCLSGIKTRVGSMGWLIWNFMLHPLFGEEDSALSPRWL